MRPRLTPRFFFGIFLCLQAAAFLYAGVSIGVVGTGADLPAGEGAIEGVVTTEAHVRGPAGAPFVFGEVLVTKPSTAAIEQRWSGVYGERTIEIETARGRREVTLPDPVEWSGVIPEDAVQAETLMDLGELPLARDGMGELESRLPPPYAVVLRALRPGDRILAREGDPLREVFIGDEAELQAWHANREGGRWPAVLLMILASVASAFFGAKLLGWKGRPSA